MTPQGKVLVNGQPVTKAGTLTQMFLAHDASREGETLYNVRALVFRKQGDTYSLVGASSGTTLASDSTKKSHIIEMDPPEHRNFRKVASGFFTPRSITRLDEIVVVSFISHDVPMVLGSVWQGAESQPEVATPVEEKYAVKTPSGTVFEFSDDEPKASLTTRSGYNITIDESSGGEILLTLVRQRIRCAGCNRKEKRRRYRHCSHCMMARYCDHICQEQHWLQHKVICKPLREKDDDSLSAYVQQQKKNWRKVNHI